MLLTGKEKNEITIITPKGIPFVAEIVEIERKENSVKCAVIKDGGDDPDITTGAHVFAEVSYGTGEAGQRELEDDMKQEISLSNADCVVRIEGGIGVGRVTKPGLNQPVGNAAINDVPREMISNEVTEVCQLCDYSGEISVVISVPEGEELAAKTFNPRLGIVGGISILGTSGIVEPMSSQALLDTIRVEINQKKALGYSVLATSPGNYGLDFMKNTYDYDLDRSVKCSNYIGDTIDMAAEMGFDKMLLTGHIGKLIKVSGGMMNTHSKEGDCRMELMAAAALQAGCDAKVAMEILQSVTTEEGVRILQEAGKLEPAMNYVMERCMFYLNKRGNDKIHIECMMYATQYGLLAQSQGAQDFLSLCREIK